MLRASSVASSAAVSRTRAWTLRPRGIEKRAVPSVFVLTAFTGHQPKRSLSLSCRTTVAPAAGGVTLAMTVRPRCAALTLRSSTSTWTGGADSPPATAVYVVVVDGLTVAVNAPPACTVAVARSTPSAWIDTVAPSGSAARPLRW